MPASSTARICLATSFAVAIACAIGSTVAARSGDKLSEQVAQAPPVPSTPTAQAAHDATAAPAAAGKTAGQAFKNIQVLKDIPQEQLLPTMQFVAASLGVECEFCHVEGAREKDDKQNKLTARHMMEMVIAINKANFNGNLQVTCYSCHRGAQTPVGVPVISDVVTSRAQPGPPPTKLPTVDQLLDKFVEASGGAEAIAKITTRVETGNIIAQGHATPIEFYAKAPDKRISIMHATGGDSITAFDGTAGWLGSGNRPARDMDPSSIAAAKMDAVFHLPTDFKQNFTHPRVLPPDRIGEKDVSVLVATASDQTPVRFYFDEDSGLLLRALRFQQTALGRNPTQIDYADYRQVDGVKIPFRWTLTRIGTWFTIQIDQVRQNVPVEDSKFTKPAAAEAVGR